MQKIDQIIKGVTTGTKESTAKTTRKITSCPTFQSRFETFFEPNLMQAVDAVQDFCQDLWWYSQPVGMDLDGFKFAPGRWLTLTGNNGTGKTMLAKTILRWARQHCARFTCESSKATLVHTMVYRSWRALVDELYDGAFGQLRDFGRRGHWLVIVDDLFGRHDPSGLGASVCDAIAERDRMWTVLTTNLSLDALAAKDRRLASRMIRDGNKVVELDTVDFSLRKLMK